jgi:hypothetical protein
MKVNLNLDFLLLLCVAAVPQSPNTSNIQRKTMGVKQNTSEQN